MYNEKTLKVSDSETINITPYVEITFFDEKQKESHKETYPVSYFIDRTCRDLKILEKLN
mgnify:CR=1 FL=1